MRARTVSVSAFVAFVLSFALVSFAHAATDTAKPFWTQSSLGSQQFGTGDAACEAYAISRGQPGSLTYRYGSGAVPSQRGSCVNSGGSSLGSVQQGCPTGFVAMTTTGRCEKTVAACPPPKVESPTTGLCVSQCSATAGKPMGSGTAVISTGASSSPPASICDGGCVFSAGDRTMSGKQGSEYFHWIDKGSSTGTGQPCDDSTPSGPGDPVPPDEKPPEPVPVPPPPGKCPGTVNGTAVNVPCEETSAPGSDSTTKPPTTSGPGTSPDAPGTEKGGSETTCTGTRCTTTDTDTVTNPDGSTTVDETVTEESKDQFCQRNPASPLCEDKKSQFGGSCQGAFTCNGDAIQCAMAQEQHRRHCEFFEKESSFTQIGVEAANGQAQPTGHPGANVSVIGVNLAAGLNSAPLFGSNSGCPNDVVIGGRYRIEFSRMCGMLNIIGVALQGFAFLIACFVVFRKGA